MQRREFLLASGTGLALATRAYAAPAKESKPRVGLIGCGWYGKCDLLRLLQVAPVEVVSLCDVDKNMLAEAADMVADSASVARTSPGPTATTARCSRRKTWTSCWSPRPIIGTRCR